VYHKLRALVAQEYKNYDKLQSGADNLQAAMIMGGKTGLRNSHLDKGNCRMIFASETLTTCINYGHFVTTDLVVIVKNK
jgi:hypothetical protein